MEWRLGRKWNRRYSGIFLSRFSYILSRTKQPGRRFFICCLPDLPAELPISKRWPCCRIWKSAIMAKSENMVKCGFGHTIFQFFDALNDSFNYKIILSCGSIGECRVKFEFRHTIFPILWCSRAIATPSYSPIFWLFDSSEFSKFSTILRFFRLYVSSDFNPIIRPSFPREYHF